jgi:hypothetical protein
MSYGGAAVDEVAVGVEPAVGEEAVGGVMLDQGAVGNPFM